MAERKRELVARRSGPAGVNEDRWYLKFDPATGLVTVEHQWSHPEAGSLETTSGAKTYVIEEFLHLANPEAGPAQAKLRALIEGVFGGGNS